MAKKKSSGHFEMSLREEEKVAKKTLSQFKREFEFYERCFNLLFGAINYLAKSTKSKPLSGNKAVIFACLFIPDGSLRR